MSSGLYCRSCEPDSNSDSILSAHFLNSDHLTYKPLSSAFSSLQIFSMLLSLCAVVLHISENL